MLIRVTSPVLLALLLSGGALAAGDGAERGLILAQAQEQPGAPPPAAQPAPGEQPPPGAAPPGAPPAAEAPPGQPPEAQPPMPDQQATAPGAAGAQTVMMADDLMGKPVQNAAGENLGDVSNLVIDPQTGQIQAVVVGVGGFLGIGEKNVALPWQQVQMSQEALLAEVSREQLEQAEAFQEPGEQQAQGEQQQGEQQQGGQQPPGAQPGAAPPGAPPGGPPGGGQQQ